MMKSQKSNEYAHPAQPPETSSLAEVREAAQACTACHLHKRATQTVFGEGPKHASIMLVGEQPGDYEDVAGKPFVGPAGKIMDRALEEAGIDRRQVYVTNAVKHFKWELAGNAGFIKNRTRARSRRAGRGWMQNCASLGRSCWSASGRQQPRQSSVLLFASRASAGKFFHPTSRRRRLPQSILLRSCDSRMKNPATANTKTLSPTYAWLRTRSTKSKRGEPRGVAFTRPAVAPFQTDY